jgi:hypothetical protein
MDVRHELLVVCAALVAASCNGRGSSASHEANSAGEATVACGSLEGSDQPCCPATWKAGERCQPEPGARACWTACLPLTGEGQPDPPARMRGSLSCGADGLVVPGQGLYPCSPNR